MTEPFRWAIFGTGAISAKFVAGLTADRESHATVVVSRSQRSAEDFAAGAGIPNAIEGYAAGGLAQLADAVYIATPPSEHARHALMCIEAGLPVLIEKPFASSASQAQQIIDAARTQGVFAMEAMWTRFLPAAQEMRELIGRREIGDVHLVTGSFGLSQQVGAAKGMLDPALGGGALAHLGCYPLSLGQWLFGTPTLVHAMGTMGQSGVDEDAAFLLRYPNGTIGSFAVSLQSWAPDDFQTLGTHGMISFRGSIVRPSGLYVSHQQPKPPDHTSFDWKAQLRQHSTVHRIAQLAGRSSRVRGRSKPYRYEGNGYHYEAREVRTCVRRGIHESRQMSLADSLAVAITIDEIRAQIGVNESGGSAA